MIGLDTFILQKGNDEYIFKCMKFEARLKAKRIIFFFFQKHDLMGHIAHQTIVMQFMLELGRSLEIDPRGCVKAFFSR